MSSLNQCCRATSVNPTIFIQIPLATYIVLRSHVSQFCLNVCTWIEAGSNNGRKQVAWDDVAKHFFFYKAPILTNSFISLKTRMLNVTRFAKTYHLHTRDT